MNAKIQVKFDKSCLKQGKTIFNHRTTVSLYIFYEINLWGYNLGVVFTIGSCLFVNIFRLTKNLTKINIGLMIIGIGFT